MDNAEPIQFVYEAPDSCPSEAEFVARVAEIGGAFQGDPGIESARRFTVVIEAGERYAGRLVVRDALGREATRAARGALCADVVRPLALFVALALEELPTMANAEEAPAPPPPSPDVPAPTRPPEPPERSGGITIDAFGGYSGNFGQSSIGLRGVAVARLFDDTRVGLVVAASQDAAHGDKQGLQRVDGEGLSGRAGVALGWGAPWTHGVVGFLAEVGVRGGRMRGTVANPVSAVGNTSCFAFYDCYGPATPERWSFLGPYVAGTLELQVPVPYRFPLHPLFGITVLWTTDYQGGSTALGLVSTGATWQAW